MFLQCPKETVEHEIFGGIGKGDKEEAAIVKAQNGTLFINEICEMPMEAQNSFAAGFTKRRVFASRRTKTA